MKDEQVVTKELIAEFKDWLSANVSKDTQETYTATLNKYCINVEIGSINHTRFFDDLRRGMLERKLSFASIGRHTAAVKKFLIFLSQRHDVDIIKLELIKCKKPPKRNPTYLTKEEIQAIRDVPYRTILELRNRTLFEFLLDTGCRVSEALGIDWKKIDFQNGEVEVLGKGDKIRTLFIKDSKEWVLEYLANRQSEAAPLFVTREKLYRLNREHAAIAIRELGVKAGIGQRVHPHLLRHTFGTYLIWANVDPRTVQELMGHEDLETTLKYYTAVTKDRMKEAHGNLGATLSGNQQPTMLPQKGIAYPLYK